MDKSRIGQQVNWQTVAIVGVGLIGGSLALGLKRTGLTHRVVGVSSSPTIESAIRMGVIDDGGGYDDIARLISDANVVFLCTPIQRIIELIPEVMAAAAPGAIISDVGSTKAGIVHAAGNAARSDVTFIGGHPMAGSEHSGVGAADPFLFQNAIYVVTPSEGVDESLVSSFAEGLGCLGARVIALDPDTHDRVAAAVSHVPQLVALALVEMAGERNESEPAHLQMAAGGFRDMTRIASSSYPMWRDILVTNASEVRSALDDLRSWLDRIDSDLENAEEHFERANRTRGTIPRDAKGFMIPLSDILVGVEDKPGVLASMTGTLYNAGLNVLDIELLKIREGEGGTFRLAFADAKAASQAVSCLQEIGFDARLR
jgi:prephenate dehydrogenase